MEDLRFAVVGIGATGTVLAAALLRRYPETVLVDCGPVPGKTLTGEGIRVSGAMSYDVPVRHYFGRITDLKDHIPHVILIATKTFHLDSVLNGLEEIAGRDTIFVSTQNGLGPEDMIAEHFGPDAAFRMSLNFGASLHDTGKAEVNFFNRPNHLGGLSDRNRELGSRVAHVLTDVGLDTEYVDDIRLYVWKKMIMKCTMASICAVTGRTIKEAMELPTTREIAEGCFKEALAVAKAMGYDLGEDYMEQVMAYLNKVGMHRDSMCYDIDNKKPTEIDFLGGKIVEYGRQKGIPTPFYIVMTNLVKALEAKYSNA
jgi:2-dehydropantoate 2-reductase